MRVSIATAPHGVVAWADKGLFLFDGQARAWKKLPLSGGNPGTPWCDGSGLCYDSKRDCLWLRFFKGLNIQYPNWGIYLTDLATTYGTY
jgi:hypothetical protein